MLLRIVLSAGVPDGCCCRLAGRWHETEHPLLSAPPTPSGVLSDLVAVALGLGLRCVRSSRQRDWDGELDAANDCILCISLSLPPKAKTCYEQTCPTFGLLRFYCCDSHIELDVLQGRLGLAVQEDATCIRCTSRNPGINLESSVTSDSLGVRYSREYLGQYFSDESIQPHDAMLHYSLSKIAVLLTGSGSSRGDSLVFGTSDAQHHRHAPQSAAYSDAA